MADAERQLDPTLARMGWGANAFDDYAELADLLCRCEALCVCGWDEPGGPADQMLWRREQIRIELRPRLLGWLRPGR